MKLLGLAILNFSLPLAAHPAECVCVKEPHPSAEKIKIERRRAYGEAAAVFVGKVIALDAYTIKLKLAKQWKGAALDEVVISTKRPARSTDSRPDVHFIRGTKSNRGMNRTRFHDASHPCRPWRAGYARR